MEYDFVRSTIFTIQNKHSIKIVFCAIVPITNCKIDMYKMYFKCFILYTKYYFRVLI